MTTATKTEILGRDGETKADMLAWFRRRGFWKQNHDPLLTALCQLNAAELDLLAGAVTAYGNAAYLAELAASADAALAGVEVAELVECRCVRQQNCHTQCTCECHQ